MTALGLGVLIFLSLVAVVCAAMLGAVFLTCVALRWLVRLCMRAL